MGRLGRVDCNWCITVRGVRSCSVSEVSKMRLLVFVLLCCCFATVASNPVRSSRKHDVERSEEKEVHRIRKGLYDVKDVKDTTDGSDGNSNDNINDNNNDNSNDNNNAKDDEWVDDDDDDWADDEWGDDQARYDPCDLHDYPECEDK